MGGFNLPPGCGTLPGELPTPPCDVCGQDVENGYCICPECHVCGGVGDPGCYDAPNKEDLNPLAAWGVNGCGLELNRYQVVAREIAEAVWEKENAAENAYWEAYYKEEYQ